jgi:DNA-binding NtrC family response regulator
MPKLTLLDPNKTGKQGEDRLSVFPIELPALRERPEDIQLLVRHFAMVYADRMQKSITAIADEFMAALVRHSWPGNVRELQNFIERSVIVSTGAALNGSAPDTPKSFELVTRKRRSVLISFRLSW